MNAAARSCAQGHHWPGVGTFVGSTSPCVVEPPHQVGVGYDACCWSDADRQCSLLDMKLPSAESVSDDAIVPLMDTGSGVRLRRTTVHLMIVAGLGAVATTAWLGVVLFTVGHGYDVSDEGFYLLMYRWWDVGAPNLTGIQYVYGPIFDLLGHNIAALRVFRLLTVLATHAAFGWAFMGWLRTRRPTAPATRWWEIAGTMVLAACGGMIYCWLPLTAGYNDVSILGALLAAAIVLRIIADVERGATIRAWVPAALGPLAVAMLLAKWSSSALTLAVVGVVGIVAVRRRSWREVGRLAAWAAGGALLTVVLMQVFVAPLTSVVSGLVAANKNMANASHAPRALLEVYIDYSVAALKAAVKAHAVLLIAAVFATLARGRFWHLVARVLVVVGLALSLRRILADGDLAGGTVNLTRFPIAVIGLLLVPALIGITAVIRDRSTVSGAAPDIGSSLTRPGGRSWAVLAMLVLLPVTQAAGTSNALHWMAINALAAWAAVVIAVLTGIEAAPPEARWLAGAATVGLVVVTACVAINGVLVNPYRTAGRYYTTAAVAGVPALASLRLHPQAASAYADLHERLLPWIEPHSRAVMAFDNMPGLVLMLDGRSVGTAWYGATDPVAASIWAECQQPEPWWGDRAPILLFNRPVSDVEVAILRGCGYDFATDYRLLAPAEQMHGLEVYVPADG